MKESASFPKSSAKSKTAYGRAGVDIDAGAALVEKIKPFAKATTRPGVMGGLGGFGALFDLKAAGFDDPILVSSTDGVGTKLKIAIEAGIHDTVGVDLVAMCVNDLVVQGATPLFFLDYFATGSLDVGTAAAVISGISDGCAQADCALIGGETAEMPGMYAPGDYDLAGFTVGAVERSRMITGATIAPGDAVLGLASNGVHSNGFSLVRKIVAEAGLSWEDLPPFESGFSSLGAAFLAPTRIYVRPLLAAFRRFDIKGLAHITGGGLLENIPRVLPEGLGAALDAAQWPLPPVFQWLRMAGGLTPDDMARTFNCGIGMVLVCAADRQADIKAFLEAQGETVFSIGRIEPVDGATKVRISGLDS